jgi:prephenate dehydratase
LADLEAIAYLGPDGSFTSQTARSWAADRGLPPERLIAYPSMAAVVKAVRTGDAAHGIVPVATAHGGPIAESHEAIAAGDVAIVETVERVCHYALLGRPGATVAALVEVVSHPMAFIDCDATLRRLAPAVTRTDAASTGAAAATVAAGSDYRLAAIAPAGAAALYALIILAERIEDDPANWTRWAVLRRM